MENLTVFILAYSRPAPKIDPMLKIGVAHTLEAHLERIVVFDVYAVGFAPRPDSRKQRTLTQLDVGKVAPKLQPECVLDALGNSLAGIARKVVVGDDRLLF